MTSDFKTELGQRLKTAREAAGLSVKEMARRLECAAVTVYAYESGQNQAPVDVVVGYSRATGFSFGRLGGLPEHEEVESVLGVLLAAEDQDESPDLGALPNHRLASLVMKTAVEVSRRLIQRR